MVGRGVRVAWHQHNTRCGGALEPETTRPPRGDEGPLNPAVAPGAHRLQEACGGAGHGSEAAPRHPGLGHQLGHHSGVWRDPRASAPRPPANNERTRLIELQTRELVGGATGSCDHAGADGAV